MAGILFLLLASPAFAIKNLWRGNRLYLPRRPSSFEQTMLSQRKIRQIRGDAMRASLAARAARIPKIDPGTVTKIPEIPVVPEVPEIPVMPQETVSLEPVAPVLREEPMPFPGQEQLDGVIFDVDGTLLDSLPAWEHSASNFLRSQGIEPPPGLDEEMAQLSLLDGAQKMKERFGLPQSPQEIVNLTLEPIWQHYLTDIPAKPGVIELLESLHAQGIKIGVATAGDKKLVLQAFARLGIQKYIFAITTCDEVGIGKQSSAVYDVTMAKMGVERGRTLVIEDSLFALQTARQAGYLTAGVLDLFHPDDHARAISRAGHYFINSFKDGYIWANESF